MQTDKEFEDFFREQLNGLEETPPAGAWEKISGEIKPKRTYYWQMAAAVLLCLLSVSVFLGLKKQPEVAEKATIAANQQHQQSNAAQRVASSTKNEDLNIGSEKSVAPGSDNQSVNSSTTVAETVSGNAIVAGQPSPEAVVVSGKPTRVTGAVAIARQEKKQKKVAEARSAGTLAMVDPISSPSETRLNIKTNTLAPEKRYENVTKNSGTNISATPEMPLVAREVPAKPSGNNTNTTEVNPTDDKTTNSANVAANPASAKTIIAQNQPVKTDTITLNVIPQLPDTLKVKTETVAFEKEEKKKKETGKTAVSLKFTPGVIARRLIANSNDEQYVRFNEQNKTKRTADLGFDVSGTVHHRIAPKTTLDGTLAFTRLRSNVHYSVSNGEVNAVSQTVTADTSSQVSVGYVFSEEKATNEFSYGSCRAGLTQDLISSGHNRFYVSAGAGINMLLSKSGRINSEQVSIAGQVTQKQVNHNAFHNVNSHLYLSAGLAKTIMPQVSVLLAPAFTYYLNSALREKQAYALKPYTFGLNFGLQYQL